MDIFTLNNSITALLGSGEEWDNDGLMVCARREIKKCAVALDATTPAINFAAANGCDALVTHHPLIFTPLARLADDSVSRRVALCLASSLSVLSYHTRLDIAAGGVNDCLCAALGISGASSFLPYGRIGTNTASSDYASFVTHCEKALNCKAYTLIDSKRKVERVAVVSGCGKDNVYDAYSAGADTFVTGEVNYSAGIEAAELGMNLVCLGHFETENVVVPHLAVLIKSLSPDLEAITYGI